MAGRRLRRDPSAAAPNPLRHSLVRPFVQCDGAGERAKRPSAAPASAAARTFNGTGDSSPNIGGDSSASRFRGSDSVHGPGSQAEAAQLDPIKRRNGVPSRYEPKAWRALRSSHPGSDTIERRPHASSKAATADYPTIDAAMLWPVPTTTRSIDLHNCGVYCLNFTLVISSSSNLISYNPVLCRKIASDLMHFLRPSVKIKN